MANWLSDPEIWASLLTLTVLEIVLGIDNLVFIALMAGRLPADSRARARKVGLGLALITRLALLGAISWIVGLTHPILVIGDHPVSWRDLVLLSGGFFLLYKGTVEIHHGMEAEQDSEGPVRKPIAFLSVVLQIMVLDIVFSLDSVITAVGMAELYLVMAAAIVIAVGIMLLASGPLSLFIHKHPTVKMLALSFLLLVGMTLVADGAGFHVPKGYIYAAIGFSIAVETLNQIAASRRKSRSSL
jgi:predicted tellurium resistance membrane protein TerC